MDKDIVTAARSWIGTRFVHQGRRKQSPDDPGGVDCLGLIVGVAAELGLTDADGRPVATYDVRDYSRQPDPAALFATLAQALQLVDASAPLANGQVAIFRYDGREQHLGILALGEDGAAQLIHAFAPARKVVEHALDETWRGRMVARFEVRRGPG